MKAIAYPAALPSPISAPIQAVERRLLSSEPGPRASRVLSRDRLANQRCAFLFTLAQAEIFNAWWRDDLYEGGAWFASNWSHPQATTAVRKFLGVPKWGDYVPDALWPVSAEFEVRGRGMEPALPALPTGVFSLASGLGTLATGGTAELPTTPEIIPGDALVLYIMHQNNATFGTPPGWTAIGGSSADSSAVFLRLRPFGRIADGTTDDVAPYTVSLGGSAWAMVAFRTLDDVQFPGAFSGSGSSYQYGLEGSGLHSKNVSKAANTNQVAFSIGFIAADTGFTFITAPPTGYTEIANLSFDLVGAAPYTSKTGRISVTYNSSLITDAIDPDAFTVSTDIVNGAGALTLAVSYAP